MSVKNSTKTTIVKRRTNRIEIFDQRKLYASIYAACLSVRTPAGEAELTAERVCRDIQPWLAKKPEVTSRDIRHHAHQHLKAYNPAAAILYKHHEITH